MSKTTPAQNAALRMIAEAHDGQVLTSRVGTLTADGLIRRGLIKRRHLGYVGPDPIVAYVLTDAGQAMLKPARRYRRPA